MAKKNLDILPYVQVPSRYTGEEINAYHKSEAGINIALCYPDIYEIGMSSLGVRIIYGLLNEMEGVACERVFAPAPDMEKLLREKGMPLFSLESGSPVKDFDILGFSLSSELNYTNILNILDLAGIPLFSKDRKGGAPLVIAGGNSVFNFTPLKPFIDVFIVGEGEEIIAEIAKISMERKGMGREDILEAVSGLEGVYVPFLPKSSVRKCFVQNFDGSFFPSRWLVPLTEIVHDRISLEIMRGCGQGCFFCQAGSCWKPVRTRSPRNLLDIAIQAYQFTGYEEISLLSFSSGDHPQIEDIVELLLSEFREKKVTLSFPSVRIDTFSFELAGRIRDIKKTGLTFAPETSERLRNRVGKKIKDEELAKLVDQARKNGWKQIKLYFMLGLPGEMEEDLRDIVRLINELSGIITIKAAFNTFIPKPHTLFERERFISRAEHEYKKKAIVSAVRNSRYIKLSFHPYEMSCVEAFLSRGDEALSNNILDVWQAGGRMENWTEHFNFSLWLNSFSKEGIDINSLLSKKDEKDKLPWSFIKV